MLVWGIHPVKEYLKLFPGNCLNIFVLPAFGRQKPQAALLGLARRNGLSVIRVSTFTGLRLPAGAVHQGVAAEVRSVWSVDFQELEGLWQKERPLVVACDQVNDPRNLGSILRSCAAFGVHAVLLPRRKSVQINGVVAKTSSGALFHVKICRVGNMVKALRELKDMGLWVAGLSPESGLPLWDMDMLLPMVLVVGAEGAGLRYMVKKTCDFLAAIPQAGSVSSMNVAAAASISLYEVVRQRFLDRQAGRGQ